MPVARLRAPVAAIVAAAFALLAAFVAVPAAATTTGNQGDAKICSKDGGWVKYEEKGGGFDKESGSGSPDLEVQVIGTKDRNEPTQVTVTAPDGYLISAYCVKAGQKTDVEPVAPTVPTLTIDGPRGKGISHFAVLLTGERDWDWTYPAPTCEGVLTVTYPDDLPADQANDVNIKVQNLETDETVTVNFHSEHGTWSGEQTFDPTTEPEWPGWDSWAFVWTQVAGTNHHWEGHVEVGCGPTPTPTPGDDPGPSPSPSDEPESTPSPSPSAGGASEGSLDGSIAVGECLEDAPWIRYDVQVKPVDTSLEDRTVELVLTDGTHTETITLGELGEDGTLSGRTLWPGASVADDGTTPTGWPGWTQLDDGTWAETDGNHGWTRGDIEARLVANPELAVDLAYPEATPECDAAPPQVAPGGDSGDGDPVREQRSLVDPTPVADAVEPGEEELPQTGSNVTLVALGALALVAAGGAFLWLRRRA